MKTKVKKKRASHLDPQPHAAINSAVVANRDVAQPS
jgi:hypothetical protein